MGVELVSPSAGKDPESGQVRLAEFQTDENDVVTSCPEGQEPWNVETGKGGGVVAGFDSAVCKNRARCSSCPVGQSGEKAKLSRAPKKTRLSHRRAYEQTDGFKKRRSTRSGIEGTNSHLDRVTHFKRLRYLRDKGRKLGHLPQDPRDQYKENRVHENVARLDNCT
jgi:hypothetical protein